MNMSNNSNSSSRETTYVVVLPTTVTLVPASINSEFAISSRGCVWDFCREKRSNFSFKNRNPRAPPARLYSTQLSSSSPFQQSYDESSMKKTVKKGSSHEHGYF